MLDAGIIRPSQSTAYACEFTVAAKKDEDGDWTDLRFCNDFRFMNEVTPLDRYPLPHPEDIFNELGDSKYFSKLDLRAGFNQIPMNEEDIEKTSFWCDGMKYEYVRMPFGLKNAPIHFQRIMDWELEQHGLRGFVRCFIDDLIVYSRTPEDHVKHVTAVIKMLEACNLRFHPSKSVFMTESVEYLGHFVGPYGLSPAAAKVKAIQDMPTPTCVEDVRSVMGLFQYYMRYVPDFAAIARPITDLTKKNQPWVWSAACEQAFCKLKSELCAPGRALRRPDFNRPFALHTDFSYQGIAAALTQEDDKGQEYMIAAISRSLNVHERVYSPYQGELLAAVWAVKSFHLYLHGVHFTLLTDHQPLQWLFSRIDLTGQSARWVLLLQEYEFTVKHRAGTANGNADALSRMPLPVEDQAPMYPVLAALLPRSATAVEAENTIDGLYPAIIADLPPPVFSHPPHLSPPGSAPATATIFHTQASQAGVVIVDLCGGIPTSLDCVLRLGYKVRGYAYVDVDPEARWVAYNRVQQLMVAYPGQVPGDLHVTFLQHLPQDVHDIWPAHLDALSAAYPASPVLFVCGWPCQDLSPAGPNTGLAGDRSSLVNAVVPVLAHLIRVHPASVGYILENGATQHNFHSEHIRVDVTAELTRMLGDAVTVDAAQCGSYAHRLRNFWTNLAAPNQLGVLMAAVHPPRRNIQNVLDPGHQVQRAHRDDQFPFYRLNKYNEPVRALPTLVSHPNSHSFRDGNQGMLQTPNGLQQPSVAERERILGLPAGATAAPGTFDATRHSLTGRSIDCHCLTTLLHAALALSACNRTYSSPVKGNVSVPIFAVPTCGPAVSSSVPEQASSYPMLVTDMPVSFLSATALPDKPPLPQPPPYSLRPVSFQLLPVSLEAQLRGIGEPELAESGGAPHIAALLPRYLPMLEDEDFPSEDPPAVVKGDIWEDVSTLHFLQTDTLPAGVNSVEAARIKRRSQAYVWKSNKLYRSLTEHDIREVPPLAARRKLAEDFHHSVGHWGARRTTALLATSFWWSGMATTAAQVTSQCPHCARVKATFNGAEKQLHPLSIEGFCYRWSVDLAGPFQPITVHGNQYVMIAIEHYTKHLEAVPIPNALASTVAYHFSHNVLARFGACAEVVTDNGSEFAAEFHDLLAHCLIDHRNTSPIHPQANGLAERAVQSIKRALRKMVDAQATTPGGAASWDEQLPWVLLGYRASTQESTKFSPMQLLYARDPIIPPATMDRMLEPLDFNDPEAAAVELLARVKYIKQAGVVVDNNLRIAQHRDTQRYARVHGGGYLRHLTKFQEGDFCYVKAYHPTTLEPKASPYILRVIGVRQSGVLELVGRCGTVITRHPSSCAPCHLPNIDSTIDTQLARPIRDMPCSICGDPSDSGKMLLCDGCNSGWHMQCLSPPVTAVPRGLWYCPACKELDPELPVAAPARDLPTVPTPQWRVAPLADILGQWDGRTIQRATRGHGANERGTVKFLGMGAGARCYEATFTDGSELRLTYGAVETLLLPLAGAVVAAVNPATTPRGLPHKWLLDTYEHARRCLTTLAPGHWTEGHVTGLLMQVNLFPAEPALGYQPANLQACVDRLVQSVSLPANVANLWPSGSAGLGTALGVHGHTLRDRGTGPLASLAPAFYEECTALIRGMVFVGSPSVYVCDMILFLCALFMPAMLVVLVPSTYHTHAPAARSTALGRLGREGRMIVLPCPAEGDKGLAKSAWIVVFRDVPTKARFLSPTASMSELACVVSN